MNRNRWAVLAAVVIAAGGAVYVATDEEPVINSPESAAATDRAVRALEKDAGFVREVTQEAGWRPLCEGRPMGSSPDAQTVYAWVHCKWIPTGTSAADPGDLPALISPIIVHLSPELRYQMPEDGADDPGSIFPESLRAAARDGIPAMDAATRELDARVATELAG
ncbi:hypothetical protein [Actinoplanes awajinensis]|uniref:DUF302 domain-containing protein n=1 Tax=Actinoplanes awajinensis subsp. mycoplanecinus TaxID=135947 RepID=A0A0X3VA76_9ACTN|nr:hypothetical protein [Actinoplanes awajinensis]KUL41660.1 hypothetical protein ADL15_03365 [Actinoplanes awajinensis subsp. mycoplanecinus]